MNLHAASLLAGALLIALPCSLSGAEKLRLVPVEDCTTAFAGDDINISMRIVGDTTPAGTLRWSHLANGRTLARGEVVAKESGDASAVANFVLRPSVVRDGVIFATTIRTEFVLVNGDKAIVSSERPLTLFPKNPFFNRNEWVKELDIELFDPTESTARVFDDAKLPFRNVRNAAALDDPTQKGILIVGEGTSLSKYRSLAETAFKAALAGRRVIMLAPADGSLEFPGSNDAAQNTPNEIRFAQQGIIGEFDKRLDANAWPGVSNTVPAHRLNVESRRGRVEISVSDQHGAWPWMEVRFPQTNGVFIVCGFEMIQHWDNGPTPRYLFLRILESLDKRRQAHNQ